MKLTKYGIFFLINLKIVFEIIFQMDFSLSSFLGHLDKEQTAESTRNDEQKVISNDVSIHLEVNISIINIYFKFPIS